MDAGCGMKINKMKLANRTNFFSDPRIFVLFGLTEEDIKVVEGKE